MTSHQRMETAMSLGIPDRVPVMCQLSIGHMLLNLPVSPAEFWYDARTFASGLCELRSRYGFDGVLVSLHGHAAGWGTRVREIRSTDDGERVYWRDGQETFHPRDELPRGSLPGGERPAVLRDLGREDLPSRVSYIPVSQGLRFRVDTDNEFEIFRLVRAELGPSYSLHGEVTSPFDYYLDLVGHQEGLLGLVDEPDKADVVLGHFAGIVSDLAVRMCEVPVDAIKISSPFAGAGFLSRKFYSRFVLPHEQRLAAAIRAKGVHAYTHTCGSIGDRLDLLLESGISGLECLDPPPLGNVHLADAKRQMRGRAFIKGNIDSVQTLLFGTHEDVLRDVRERLLTGKEGGGFILSTACSVAPGVPPDRLVLLRELAEKWGG